MASEGDVALDISKLKVPDLKRELRSRGLPITGNKNELIERLNSSLQSSKLDTDSVDDLIDEDLLNDDEHDDEHLEGDADLNITDLETTIDQSPTEKINPPKRKLEEICNATEQKGHKKVVLNRVISNDEPTEHITSNGNDANENKDETNSTTEGEKKVIKLSELTAKERLEMRAKKFGPPVSDDAKKAARAARFGETTTVASSGNITIGNGSTSSVEQLKKRAERFGSVVSQTLSKVEIQEKLEKRKQRFGVSTTAATTPTTKIDNDKAKQLRLERFKTTVK